MRIAEFAGSNFYFIAIFGDRSSNIVFLYYLITELTTIKFYDTFTKKTQLFW